MLQLGADSIVAENVVVATGTFGRTPSIPDFALDLDPSIRQLHSSEYRKPAQLKPGSVLVVGGSHSGTDIAFEVASTHPTVLAGRDPGQVPVRLDHWSARVVLPAIGFLAKHVITRRTPIGRKAMDEVRFHGLPMLRVKRSDLQARGVDRILGRVTGVHDGRPVVDGVGALDVANVVWCTGFRQVFDWIDLPIFGADGWPREMRGVVPGRSGLVLLRARVPVRGRLNGAARSWQRCRLCRRADQSPSRKVTRTRSLSPMAARYVLRSDTVRGFRLLRRFG